MKKGYAVFEAPSDDWTLCADFDMPVTLIEAMPNVRDAAGKIAVQKGPVIYCAEALDNCNHLWSLAVNTTDLNPQEVGDKLHSLIVSGWQRKRLDTDALYAPMTSSTFEPLDIRLIPYYAFANRGETEMAVWLSAYPAHIQKYFISYLSQLIMK